MDINKVIILRVNTMGRVDNGVKIPNTGYKKFIKNPINIKSVILNPIESNNASAECNFFNFRILKRIKPGINKK